jgi:hypothetical protein
MSFSLTFPGDFSIASKSVLILRNNYSAFSSDYDVDGVMSYIDGIGAETRRPT